MTEPSTVNFADGPQPSGIERRVWTRFSSNLSTSCRIKASLPNKAARARVRNISVGGVSLIVASPVEIGSVVPLELRSSLRDFGCTLELRVLYCVEHPGGDSILGGSFVQPLTEDQLRNFLGWREIPKNGAKDLPIEPLPNEAPPQ
jgi:hypothetical protein